MSNDTEMYSAPEPLLIYGVVHCYFVAVFGTLVNGLALWCIYQCQKTQKGVKLILGSVFFPLLLICLFSCPGFAEFLRSLVMGQPDRVPRFLLGTFILLYSIFTLMELMSIAALAILRSIAVWCPRRNSVDVCQAVGIVVAVFIYSLLVEVTLHIFYVYDVLPESIAASVILSVSFICLLIPVVVTLTAYAVMMVAIHRNKNRLASVQNSRQTRKVLDPATKSMLAVFLINLLFGMPHVIFHLLEEITFAPYIVIHIIFYTHYVLDPIAFIWFNQSYRKLVGNLLKRVFSGISGSCNQTLETKHRHAPVSTSVTPVTPSATSV